MPQKLAGNTNRQPRVRNICFTVNNPTMQLEPFGLSLQEAQIVDYFLIGLEVGASGTPHFQGYVEFTEPTNWSKAHELLLNGHMETRRGTAQQASDYCKKDGTFIEWGQRSEQGERTDLQQVAEAVIAGVTLLDIAMNYPVQFIKFHKGIQALQCKLIEPRCTTPTVRVFWGGTGTGKSYRARQWLPNAFVWHPQMGS